MCARSEIDAYERSLRSWCLTMSTDSVNNLKTAICAAEVDRRLKLRPSGSSPRELTLEAYASRDTADDGPQTRPLSQQAKKEPNQPWDYFCDSVPREPKGSVLGLFAHNYKQLP